MSIRVPLLAYNREVRDSLVLWKEVYPPSAIVDCRQ